MIRFVILSAATTALSVMAPGCKSLGPRTVPSDRFNYNEAGAQSTNEQLLLNIVRLRYGEPTYWLEIGSMLSQYEIKAGGSLTHFDYMLKPISNAALRASYGLDHDAVVDREQEANFNFVDRPTITYVPLQGKEFANRLMAPIPPATIVFLAESGWSIDRLVDCCVQRINGVPNSPIHGVRENEHYNSQPFEKISDLLRTVQDEGELRFTLDYDAKEKTAYLEGPLETDASKAPTAELWQSLDIDKQHARFKLTNRPTPGGTDELALQTRSLLGTLFALSESFSPPSNHLQSGQVLPGMSTDQNASAKWLDIKFSKLPVADAFVQVRHNGYWFYIPRSDFRSKRTFALLTYLFSLQTADVTGVAPLLTVPTGG